jgi:hypothetical protein
MNMQASFIFNISIWHSIYFVYQLYHVQRYTNKQGVWVEKHYGQTFSISNLVCFTNHHWQERHSGRRMKVGDLNLIKTWTPTYTMCLLFSIYFLCITLVHVYIVAFSNKNFNLSLFMKFPYALELFINSLLWKESLNSDGQLHNSININKTNNHLSP